MNWQYPLLAPSVGYPQMVWGCMCLCVYTGIAQNELICGYATIVHASSSFRTHTHTHTPFEDCELTGLKVDIANELIIHKFKWIKASLAVAFLGDMVQKMLWQLTSAMWLGNETVETEALPHHFLSYIFNVGIHFGSVIFHLWVTAALQWQWMPKPMKSFKSVSGIMCSTGCQEGLANQFTKVCDFCSRLAQTLILVENNHSFQKHACQIFTDKALLTIAYG